MKQDALKGIIQFILTLGVMVLFELFFFKVLGNFGLNFSGDTYTMMNLLKYVVELLVVIIVYHGDIFSGKESFKRSLFTSIVVAIVTFIVMVVFTILLKRILAGFNITIAYGFVNYFDGGMSLSRVLEMIINCFIKPCLVCGIFVLGISNIIRKEAVAMVVSGIGYAIYLILMNHISLDVSMIYLLSYVVNLISLTFLYKNTGNIFTCFVTYILYFLCGSLLISYIL